MTMSYAIITVGFCIAMAANVVALVRHWRMMRVLQIALNSLVETQKQFNELIDAERSDHKMLR
jgi:hypothetical protein